ncbi:MAG TPA: bifunctional diaminohydroxyphosphoribosylaminopyrimidine deaminase/5-amino-6-(5-phosphoribosylamino)uracil reductase RibD [Actinomycetes bacterium]|nr:bifunctional diaminohydroxyphosphoribosylaminopyrimidine deaminase/5-amino-6-(5-phosphoribosylamino)uracil reductase RibD [Actinomycetes bacterium]
MATTAELAAMRRALELAEIPGGPPATNPRVGAVLLSPDGRVLGEGWHRGAGTPHAEVEALAAAGESARGATAVVTLEPCDHVGRTGPCSQALIDAGIARVVYAMADPNPVAGGGAGRLRAAGVEVEAGPLAEEAEELNRAWAFAICRQRPFVTWKYAATLDGRVAAADGTSRWITSPQARRDVHARRSRVNAVLVGTGTVLADDPWLTVRADDDTLAPTQPLRVVMGRTPIPSTARVLDDAAPSLLLRTRDPHEAIAALHARGLRHVWLEGGPTLAAAFVRAGLVDEVVAYLAPALLGAGPAALADAGVATIGHALRLALREVTQVGPDLRIIARPLAEGGH